MEPPFVFGRIATDKNFTDREKETRHIIDNFNSLINTILISPRRWGKSSLVNKAADIAVSANPDLRIVSIDLFNVRNEQQFYSQLAQKVISATSGRWDEAVENVKSFFSRLVPKISIGTDPTNEISIDFDWEEVSKTPDEILDLAESIAQKKGLRIVICIDEFQNISEFEHPEYFQKKLRSHWQRHQHVAYCLYGSKRHMMMEVFTNSSMPFYKFGDLMFLDKIKEVELYEFFMRRFKETGKSITEKAAMTIARLVDNHPYYSQQLAQLSWLRTKDECDEIIVEQAFQSLTEQLSLLFINITEGLTKQQLNLLKAITEGIETFGSIKTFQKYGLTSATSAQRAKNALIKANILDDSGGKIAFQDPIYLHWLKEHYFVN